MQRKAPWYEVAHMVPLNKIFDLTLISLFKVLSSSYEKEDWPTLMTATAEVIKTVIKIFPFEKF